MVSPTPHSDGFYSALAEMAERLRHTIIALPDEQRSEYVQRRAAKSEIVFGVWTDPRATGGFGFHLIKGQGHLAALLGATLPNELTTIAVPCVGLDQAVAAEQLWGKLGPTQNPSEDTSQEKRKVAKHQTKKRTPKGASAAPKRMRRR
jgi:hypothetical protein